MVMGGIEAVGGVLKVPEPECANGKSFKRF